MIAEPRPWDAQALLRVGAAQYRTGDYAGALATLERGSKLQGGMGTRSRIIAAMAHQRLGHTEEAKKNLGYARAQMNGITTTADLKTLLSEGESQIGTTPAK
jgi:hypothetical protein